MTRTRIRRQATLYLASFCFGLLLWGLPGTSFATPTWPADVGVRAHLSAGHAPAAAASVRPAWEERVDQAFGAVVGAMARVLFADVMPGFLKDALSGRRDVWLYGVARERIDAPSPPPDSADLATWRAWAAQAAAPEGTFWSVREIVTYEEGWGDRKVSGYGALLLSRSHALNASVLHNARIAADETGRVAWLEASVAGDAEDATSALEGWSRSHLHHPVALVDEGLVRAVAGVTEVIETGILRWEAYAWAQPEQSIRELRDLTGVLRAPHAPGPRVPFIVLWLIVGAVFFTFRMGFVNIRAFGHALRVLRGKYDNPSDQGEVSHFQALASALSATVGLGNIAGVAVAIGVGGPGAVFWMLVAAFFGMTSKFVECTLGQMYRHVDERNKVLGGPMMYLHHGLAERGLGGLGRMLAIVFMVFCIGGSLGGGNMFQANQAYTALSSALPFGLSASVFGVLLIVAVGVVILGGIRRIGRAAAAIVPLMCTLYVLSALVVLLFHAEHVPYALFHIVADAFSPSAMYGGAVGVIIVGFQRAAFSNEAGIGSASIAHAAAKTKEPVREGTVALLEPFIDTVIVCLATGLVIVVSGVLDTPAGTGLAGQGALLTSAAFGSVFSWFPSVLAIAIVLFAYSTMLSWSYYGERSWVGLFGERTANLYRVLFLAFIYIGSVSSLGNVIDFSDLMILSMAFPNILGLYLLVGKVRAATDDYLKRMDDERAPSGEQSA